MKKIHLLFGLVMSLLLVGVVKAANIYDLDWKTQNQTGVVADRGIDFNGNYLTVDYSSEAVLTLYDKYGKEIKHVGLGRNNVATMTAYGNDIYLVGGMGSSGFIAKYDKDLNQLKKTSMLVTSMAYYQSSMGLDILIVDDTTVKFIDSDDSALVIFNRNLENQQVIELDEDNADQYIPAYQLVKKLPKSFRLDNYPTAYTYRGTDVAIGTMYDEDCLDEPDGDELIENRCEFPRLYLFDQTGNQKWYKQLDDYKYISEVRFVDNYVVIIAHRYDNSAMDLLIYDMNGNQVQKITSTSGFMNISDTAAGFMVTEGYCPSVSGKDRGINLGLNGKELIDVPNNSAPGCCTYGPKKAAGASSSSCVSNHQVYYLVRNIETKVTKGKGTVTAIKSSKPGEPVTFTVTPAEGYVLGEVRVTDVNGKTIVFKQNTFTMPNADVLVEAVFLPANPETKDIAILTIAILGITAGAVILLNHKKLKEIN